MKNLYYLVLAAMIATAGCDSKAPQTETPPQASEEKPAEPSKSEDGKADAKPNGAEFAKDWKVVAAADLTPEQTTKLGRAQEAQKAMGGALVSTLSQTIAKSGLAAGIEACNVEAPKIAASVAKESAVEIGRTSTKLRNPKNAPPAWLKPMIADGGAETRIAVGPKGEVGWIAPIMTGELCVKCHGDVASIEPEVKTTLAKLYPDDKATGFAEGDLRGWFWVKVN